jgi:hypothetical protein
MIRESHERALGSSGFQCLHAVFVRFRPEASTVPSDGWKDWNHRARPQIHEKRRKMAPASAHAVGTTGRGLLG